MAIIEYLRWYLKPLNDSNLSLLPKYPATYLHIGIQVCHERDIYELKSIYLSRAYVVPLVRAGLRKYSGPGRKG